ncbi:MAG TPA: GNAT family N-acetyltransferase [Actinomycetes bacterium]|nr:GNAT family N-acetyltransferase [Actinomycetes bacterium]
MDIRWLDSERPDRRDIDGAVAVLEAARVSDAPHQPIITVAQFVADLRYGWDGDPSLIALARDGRGRVVGVLEVVLPSWDNLHLGFVGVTVDPDVRRQGIGRQLFELGADRVGSAGRTLVVTDSYDSPATRAFAEAVGLGQASVDIQRRQELRTVDWDRLGHEYRLAEEQAADYELIRLPGATPEQMVSDIVGMTEAINDAPIDDWEVEDEVFSPARLRAWETAQAARRRRIYRLVARQRSTGTLAGHTMVGVFDEFPWIAHQWDTSVVRAHRGHRLGQYLKIGMLLWLQAAEPQLRIVDTWNAASNDRMIAINELLGYKIVTSAIGWQRRLPGRPDSPLVTPAGAGEPVPVMAAASAGEPVPVTAAAGAGEPVPVTAAAGARQPRLEAAPRDQRS